jgi:glutamyl-tRNA synthetase
MTAARPRLTRLAPTPSGALHVGNARTFIATWALARHEGWRVVLRLEDLDLGRVKPGAHDASIADLRWLALDWDGEPVVQSADLGPYRAALESLAARGLAFRCDRSRSEIRNAASAPHAEDAETRYPPDLRPAEPWPRALSDARDDWHANHRLRVEPMPEAVNDELLGAQTFNPGLEAGDLVVWTKLGVPAYQLAVVVDDARQGVTDVVRGDDLLASAARQQVLARHLGVPHARWWHLPLVYEADGKRLAKRHGSHSLAALRDAGVAAERVIGWCAWSLGLIPERAPLRADAFVDLCAPGALRHAAVRTHANPAVFSDADLKWLQGA